MTLDLDLSLAASGVIANVAPAGSGGAGGSNDVLLLEDGVSGFLLEDGVSFLKLE